MIKTIARTAIVAALIVAGSFFGGAWTESHRFADYARLDSAQGMIRDRAIDGAGWYDGAGAFQHIYQFASESLSGPNAVQVDGVTNCFQTAGPIGWCASIGGDHTLSGTTTFSHAGTAVVVTNTISVGGATNSGNSSWTGASPTLSSTNTSTTFDFVGGNTTQGVPAFTFDGSALPTPAAAATSGAIMDIPVPEPTNTATPPVPVMYFHPSSGSLGTGGPYDFVALSGANRSVYRWYAVGTLSGGMDLLGFYNAGGNKIWSCTGNAACAIGTAASSLAIAGTNNNAGYIATGNAAFPAPAATVATAWYGGWADGGTAGLVQTGGASCVTTSATFTAPAGCPFGVRLNVVAATGTWTITLPGSVTRTNSPMCRVNDENQPPLVYLVAKPSTTQCVVKAYTFAAVPAATTAPNYPISVEWTDNGG